MFRIVTIIVILAPILIWGITNGTILEITSVYKSPTWVLATMACASTSIIGNISKVQGTTIESNPLHIYARTSTIVTTSSL
jgi:hypothetical protein